MEGERDSEDKEGKRTHENKEDGLSEVDKTTEKRKRKKKKKKKKKTAPDPLRATFETLAMRARFQPPLALQYSRKMGRHVVATRRVEAGELLLTCPPFAAVVADEFAQARCHQCFQTAKVVLLCAGCKFACFCSTKCSEAAKAVHTGECEALKKLKLQERGLTAQLRLLIRLLNLREMEISEKERRSNAKAAVSSSTRQRLAAKLEQLRVSEQKNTKPVCFEDVMALVSHNERLEVEAKAPLLQQAFVVRDLVGEELWPEDIEIPLSLLERIFFNAHQIMTATKEWVGLALYPAASYLNHSCLPNAMRSFDAHGAICFRALRPIAPGEPVCYTYIDLFQTTRARRRMLRSRYFIQKCDCHRCMQGAQNPSDGVIGAFLCTNCDGAGLVRHPALEGEEEPTQDVALKCSNEECKENTSLESLLAAFTASQVAVEEARQIKQPEEQRAALLAVLERRGAWMHKRHWLGFKIHTLLLNLAKQQQQHERMRAHALVLRDCVVECVPGVSSVLSDVLMMCSEAAFGIAAGSAEKATLLQTARKELEEVVRLRTLCYGREHSYTANAVKRFRAVCGELEQLASAGSKNTKVRVQRIESLLTRVLCFQSRRKRTRNKRK